MTTKKQMRAEVEERRLAREEEYRRTGLIAQKKDRESRSADLCEAWRKQHDTKHSMSNRVAECPLCQDLAPRKTKIKENI